jgi:3-deoxy-manno-octulosonate cytidylyltransferase (CMP-KDO synthetase)
MRTIVVVPARLASTRLPRKALLRETGKFMIEHVWERVRLAKNVARLVIATDAREIEAACRSFGAEVVMTRDTHVSGTDRCAEAYATLVRGGERADLVVNVQGDEPEVDPAHIEKLIAVMASSKAPMGTLAEPFDDPEEAARPQVVKVVLDHAGRCLYFSRSPIPSGPGGWLRHVGMYAFTPAFLEAFTRLAPAELEKRERLEQLRALAHGHAIQAAVVTGSGVRGIDTPEDYAAFVSRWRGRGKL